MAGESFTFHGSVSSSNVGGSNNTIHVGRSPGADVDQIRRELSQLRARVEQLDPATAGRDSALRDISALEAAAVRGAPSTQEAQGRLRALESWSKAVGVALDLGRLSELVRSWFS